MVEINSTEDPEGKRPANYVDTIDVDGNFIPTANTLDLDVVSRRKTSGNKGESRYMGFKYEHPIRLSVDHENEKNDTDSNLTFKKFRRDLSFLKRSVNCNVLGEQIDFDSIESSDDYDDRHINHGDKPQNKDTTYYSTLSEKSSLEQDDDRPSLYALQTVMRSKRCITKVSTIPKTSASNIKRRSREWLKSFYHTDPRWQICNSFDDLAYEGVKGIDETGRITNNGTHLPILRAFSRVGVFSVWRPTSKEAIRRMMTGEGTGKGMDIKGKSATRGKWSGYVPFLQIHHNEDKLKIRSMRANTRVRVFYPNEHSRDRALMTLSMVGDDMMNKCRESQRIITEVEEKGVCLLEEELLKPGRDSKHISMKMAFGNARRRLTKVVDYSQFEAALDDNQRNTMDDASMYKIDEYASVDKGCYGLDIPEKIFWEAFVSKQGITREDGSEYDFGRPSMPEFQAMNLESLRKAPKSGPRPVLWHAGCEDSDRGERPNPLCPYGLLMAYEENEDDVGKVTPVVSDFDCFLVGTSGVQYRDPLGKQELSMLNWCVKEIEVVLDNAKGRSKDGEEVSWTRQWLDVKKKYAFDPRFQVPMPKMGYADPRSHAMMKGAVYSLKGNGAVRHGPECFNYSVPQPLDDKFLVISDMLPGLVPWKYVTINELKEILSEKIDDGFAFPLNPKWILCDEGWKDIYDKLLTSKASNVQDAMNIWYPAHVRERIDSISNKHPNGFGSSDQIGKQRRRQAKRGAITRVELEEISADLAELQLERYKHARTGVEKLRKALLTTPGKPQKRKKSRAFGFFSSALLMSHIGTQSDAYLHNKERDTCDSVSGQTLSSISSVSEASQVDMNNTTQYEQVRSRRRSSLSHFIRKRLSLSSKKKMGRRSSL